MREIAIEGIDGSGKSSVSAFLAEFTEKRYGERSRIVSPIRVMNDLLGEDCYFLWGGDRHFEALSAFDKTTHELRQKALDEEVDLLIYDRHWMTVEVDLLRKGIEIPDSLERVQAAFLRTPPFLGKNRLQNDLDAPWSSVEELAMYAAYYEQLAKRRFEHMIGIYNSDEKTGVGSIAGALRWDLNIGR